MLEFIKEIGNENLTKKAVQIENDFNLDNIDPISLFAEILVKLIYEEYTNTSNTQASFGNIVHDRDFDYYLVKEYQFSDLLKFQDMIREYNSSKHNTSYTETDKHFKITIFLKIYDLAVKYYERKTGNKIYKQLTYSDVASEIKSSKSNVIEQYKKEIVENIKCINSYKEEIKQKTIENKKIVEINKRIKTLEKENKNILIQKNNVNTELKFVQNELTKKDNELHDLKEKYNSFLIEKEEYEKVNSEMKSVYNKIKKETDELKIQSQQLFNEIDINKKKIKEMYNTINNMEGIKTINDKIIKLNEKNDEVLNNQDKYIKSFEETDQKFELDLKKELDSIDKKIKNETPRCYKCNSLMVIKGKEDNIFWGCPNYPDCNGKTRPMDQKIKDLIARKKELLKYFDKPVESEVLKEDITINNNVKINLNPLYKIDNFSSYMFNTLVIPNNIFKNKDKYDFNKYNKFIMVTNLSKNEVEKEQEFIYTLANRILNRGFLLPASEFIDEAMNTRFNKSPSALLSDLFDSVEYKNPWINYDSNSEKVFADKMLSYLVSDKYPKRLKSWLTYVHPQARFDFITNKSNSDFYDSRADFYICKDNKKCVIELDGSEHSMSPQLEKDQSRDNYLNDNDCKVFRFKVVNPSKLEEEFNSFKSDYQNLKNINEIISYFKNNDEDDNYLECDIKYMLAIKLCYQLILTIAKGLEDGFITNINNISFISDNTIFDKEELEYILDFAKTELTQLIENLKELYGFEFEFNLSNKDNKNINIYFGDGNFDSDSILIRDVSLDYNFINNIRKIEEFYKPKNISERNVTYFLKYIYGYDSFREGQFEAVKRLLLHEDTIVLLPTGAGKSIIYQLSSFLVPGIIIVISPLTSLIEDQVFNLEFKFGINNALAIYSGSPLSRERTNELMLHPNTSLIYISPERIQIPGFRESVEELLKIKVVYSLAIDEAHCVSEWGHDFRPSYLYISKTVKTLFKKGDFRPSIFGLTGTASAAVLNDVKRDLNIVGEEAIILPKTFDRQELKFSVYQCKSKDKLKELDKIITEKLPNSFKVKRSEYKTREHEKMPGIIFTPNAYFYSNSAYSAYHLMNQLKNKYTNLDVKTYFSKVPNVNCIHNFQPSKVETELWKKEIKENAKQFKLNKVDILTATKAFGMGIDKENIRFVIHQGIPNSLEEYYQEAGRAGRDRKDSECIIIFSNDNKQFNTKLLDPLLTLDKFYKLNDELNEKIKNNDTDTDDLNRLTYFYKITFPGINEEMRDIKSLVRIMSRGLCFNLNEYNDEINEIIRKENYTKLSDQKSDVSNLYQDDALKAINRLIVLGIVEEYDYNYNGIFKIKLNDFTKESIKEHYTYYVAKNDLERSKIEGKKIQNIEFKDNNELIIKSAEIYLNYIYDTIEKSRRNELRTMYTVVKDTCELPEQERDKYIRNQILNYFNSSEENAALIDKILNGQYKGFYALIEKFRLNEKELSYSDKEIIKSKNNIINISRQLETHVNHPGLLYYLALSQIVANVKDYEDIVNNIFAANKFAKEFYEMDDNYINEMFYRTTNLILSKNYKLFGKLVSKEKEINKDFDEFITRLLKSEYITDENKDIVLIKYVDSKLVKGVSNGRK